MRQLNGVGCWLKGLRRGFARLSAIAPAVVGDWNSVNANWNSVSRF
jgi:hypothetical protein